MYAGMYIIGMGEVTFDSSLRMHLNGRMVTEVERSMILGHANKLIRQALGAPAGETPLPTPPITN